MVREISVKLKALSEEFTALKFELFQDNMFVQADEKDPRWTRYSQLLGFFCPQFRSNDWKSPLGA